MPVERVHYVVIARKTGHPYIVSRFVTQDNEMDIRKQFNQIGHEVILRTLDFDHARTVERDIEAKGRQRGASG